MKVFDKTLLSIERLENAMIELATFVMVACLFVPFAMDKAGSVYVFVKNLVNKL